jgi:hypothetical protein
MLIRLQWTSCRSPALKIPYDRKWQSWTLAFASVTEFTILLRLLLARYPKYLNKVMQIIHRVITTDIFHRAGYLKKQVEAG